MEIKKVTLDRSKVSSSYIEQKQDFDKVLNNVKLMKSPTWKSPWFYGAVGLSSVAIAAISLSSFNKENTLNEKKTTLEKSPIQIAGFVSPAQSEIKSLPKKEADQKSESPKKKTVKKSSDLNLTVEKKQNEIVNVHEVVATEIPVVKQQNHSGLPSISGVSTGVLSKEKLEKSGQIESNSSYSIVSYKIQFYNGSDDIEVQINGNKLPQDVIAHLVKYNIGQMIFFTEIKGVSENGKINTLPSMNFKLIN